MSAAPQPGGPAARRGRFVTFEGVDGAGKSTQIAATAQQLRRLGIEPLVTREPGATPLGEALRAMMLTQSMEPLTETLLMFAARLEHVRHVIEPALAGSRWVLSDRFTDASYAYQGAGRGVDAQRIAALERWIHPQLRPDLTIVVDVDAETAAQRRRKVRDADRFEAEPAEFFERVRAAYLARAEAESHRFLVVDGRREPQEVLADIMERLRPWLS